MAQSHQSNKLLAANTRTFIAIFLFILAIFGYGIALFRPVDFKNLALFIIETPTPDQVQVIQSFYNSFLFACFSTSFVVLFWEKITKLAQGNIVLELSDAINDRIEKYSVVETRGEEAYNLASRYILGAKEVRVVGHVPVAGNKRFDGYINEYLTKTIKRLQSSKEISYKRICNSGTNEMFHKHLRSCLTYANIHSHDLKLILINNYKPPYTYLIIDKEFYLLTLNQFEKRKEERFFITKNEKAIEKLVDHFDFLWDQFSEENGTLTTETEFEDYYHKFKTVGSKINLINNEFFKTNRVPSLNKFLENMFIELSDYVSGIPKNSIEVHHNKSTSSVLNIFCLYFNLMDRGDEYMVITTPEFWKKVLHPDFREYDFLLHMEKLIKTKKVLVSRILLLEFDFIPKDISNNQMDEETTEKYHNYYTIKRIIEKHITWLNHDNYMFKIYFYKRKERATLNRFSLIKYKSGDTILFTPHEDHAKHVNYTSVVFDKSKSLGFENQFSNILELIESQKVSSNHIDFLKNKINSTYFNSEVNLKNVIGENYIEI